MSRFTRVEKAGPIFARVTGLIRSGVIKWEDRPLWYDVYAAHPPHREPVWDYKAPKHDQPVRQIFYKEDTIRARFYRTFGSPGAISMANERTKSLSQRFIDQYEAEKAEHPDEAEEALFERTTKVLIDQGLPLQQVKAREFVGMRVSEWRAAGLSSQEAKVLGINEQSTSDNASSEVDDSAPSQQTEQSTNNSAQPRKPDS
uniref:Small ribosomal subunit protein mS23 n=1 Tax=Plectus sambesii TaxID=2011161 RepID=A0A914VZ57_9BILA